jgi:hypothetical protein
LGAIPKTTNAPNERIKRVYFTYMKEARRYSEPSIDAVAKALHRFESYTRFKDFKSFHHQQAVGFKAHLSAQVNGRTKEALSKATLYSTLAALKGFLQWPAGQPGYKSKFTYSDAEYFNLGRGDTAIAKAHREQSVPTLEQIRYVISTMPSDIERRSRALIAFELLTGGAGWGHRFDEAKTYRLDRRESGTRRPRGEDEIPQDLRHILFPGGGRYPANRDGLGPLFADRKALGPG